MLGKGVCHSWEVTQKHPCLRELCAGELSGLWPLQTPAVWSDSLVTKHPFGVYAGVQCFIPPSSRPDKVLWCWLRALVPSKMWLHTSLQGFAHEGWFQSGLFVSVALTKVLLTQSPQLHMSQTATIFLFANLKSQTHAQLLSIKLYTHSPHSLMLKNHHRKIWRLMLFIMQKNVLWPPSFVPQLSNFQTIFVINRKTSGDALSLVLAMQCDLLRKIVGHGKSLRLICSFPHALVSTFTKWGTTSTSCDGFSPKKMILKWTALNSVGPLHKAVTN